MTLDKIVKVLEIVARNVDDPTTQWLQAEHDIIFLPIDNRRELPADDVKALEELGAFKSKEADCWALFT